VDVERGLIAPRLDQEHAALILRRQQNVKLLTTVLAANAVRVPLSLDELIAVLGFHLELDDDHDAAHRAHRHFLRPQSATSSMAYRASL
jgi:hypothetical protein